MVTSTTFEYIWDLETRRAARALFARRRPLAACLRGQGLLLAMVTEMPDHLADSDSSLLVMFVENVQGMHLLTLMESVRLSIEIEEITGIAVTVLPSGGMDEFRRRDYRDLFTIDAACAMAVEEGR